MEDDESGGSSFNSSDGGSGSWLPSSSHKNINQLVPNREGLHFLSLKSWSSGDFVRMESKQLLSNDFYTRQFSRAQPEQSDGDFDEESDEEGDEQRQGHAGEEDGSDSDYDRVYEETQLLQHYNAAHYSKVDHEERRRGRGLFDSPLTTENNRHKLGGTQVYQETQLLDNYDLGCYGNVQQEMGKLTHLPRGDHPKDLEMLQHKRVNSDAETADEAERTEVLDSDSDTEDEATTSRQDQQEVLWKGKPNSEFRQERMFEFDMDLNVSLEEEMDCEFYGEPRNQDTQVVSTPGTPLVTTPTTHLVTTPATQLVTTPATQLVTTPATQLVNHYYGGHGDTQLISTPGKEFLGIVSSSHPKAVATDANAMPCELRGGVDSNKSGGSVMLHSGTKPSSSSGLDLPSVTTESKLLAIPSASEASEGSPFQISVGTVHAESIRLAAMQPLTWIPKVKLDDHISRSPTRFGNRRDTGKSVYRPELPPTEPEWMRDYGSRGDSQGKENQEERIGAPGSSTVQEFSFPKDSNQGPRTQTSGQTEVAEQGAISPQASISGVRSLFGTSYTPGPPYNGTSGTPGGETRFSQMKTALPPRSSFGPRLPSPTSSMNYLDSLDPGEEVQAQALDMVDKLVWLNTADVTPTSPPRKYRKSFPGLPPATPVLPNPALQVFEFEDTPSVKGPQANSSLSLIKEIQAGWKKKAEQNHLAQTTSKVKDKGLAVLPEGERLSKLLTENDLNKICEPKLPLDVASTRRLSAKLPGKGEACSNNATAMSSALESAVTQERVTGFKGDNVANETKRLRGNLAEPAEVADDDLLNVVRPGLRRLSSSRGLKSEDLMEQNRTQGEREGKVPDGTQILTRRRSQGTRNRRENIRVPDAVLPGNNSSPEGTMHMEIEVEKNISTSRKRRSLTTMLRDRSAKKARSTAEEEVEDQNETHEDQNEAHEDQNEAHEDQNEAHEDQNEAHEDQNEAHEDQNEAHEDQNEAHEDQNEAHEDADILSSPTSSGGDPMFIVPAKTSSRRRKINTDDTDKDDGKVVVDTEMPAKGKKRIRLSEAEKLLGADVIGDMRREDGVKTRSLRQLRRNCNDDNRTEPGPTIPQVVQKRSRSVRRGPGIVQGAPKVSIVDDDRDLQNEIEQDARTSTSSATFQGDSDNDGMEGNNVSSPDQSENENEETSDQRGSHIDPPVEDNRLRMTRTRSIADVSSPSTPVLQPAPSPFVTGKRGRGASVKPEVIEEANAQFPCPSFAVPPAGKGMRMRTVRRRRDPQIAALPSENNAMEFNPEGSASVSTEGSLRTRRGTNVSVLFSHGLSEDTVKKQRKIVERLDGKVTRKAADCTHFVAEKFVRTGNMLESMAAGKFVVTFAWLESCHLANCFIEERNFLLQDDKKERELGFSMRSTILAAQQKPLLQGIRVLLTPNISPKPQAIAAIVLAAGGQVVEEYEGPAPNAQNEDFCIVIANEDDLEVCVPYLDQGAQVYRSELILSGIISHHLDFSKHELFDNYRGGRRALRPR